MILEDETYYLPIVLPPLFYERFGRVLREVLSAPKVVHGAAGFPGQNPRTGAATAYR